MANKAYPFVLDADAHWSEPADLFTKNAPAAIRDKLPRVKEADVPHYLTGVPQRQLAWVFEDKVIGPFSAGGVIDREGNKCNPHISLYEWDFDEVHRAAYDPKARLELLDESGIDAQIIFPTTMGLGGQNLAGADDRASSLLAIEVYNDVQSGIQEDSGNRLIPLPLMPAWDIDASVAEAKRCAARGARGVNMTSDPSELGAPDLADRAWDPFWEVCTENQMPIHFHIGASVSSFQSISPWGSLGLETKMAIGGAMLFLGNARVIANLVVSDIFDRHPDLQVVSVESGTGWIPFLLEAMEYEMVENAPDDLRKLKKTPIQYFRDNMYATFWFENNYGKLGQLLDTVGEDKVMFETDFPHPTCLFPDPVGHVAKQLSTLTPQVQAKVMGENGRRLYRL